MEVDAEVQKVIDRAVKDSIHEVDKEAVNYMNTKFPDDAPLTFLADNPTNSKKWTMKEFNEHQLDYEKAKEDAYNHMGVPRGEQERGQVRPTSMVGSILIKRRRLWRQTLHW